MPLLLPPQLASFRDHRHRRDGLSASVVAAEDSTQQTANSAPPSLQSQFDLKFDAGAIVGLRRKDENLSSFAARRAFACKHRRSALAIILRRKDDSFDTQYIQEGRRLGDVLIQFRQPSGDWQPADTAALAASGKGIDRSNPDGHEFGAAYRVPTGPESSLLVTNQFAVEDQAVVWKINLENDSDKPLEIGDLALPFAMNSQFRRAQPSSAVLKHSFISGHGSFLFWMRPNSVGPYLLATPLENTQLEYWEAPQFAGPPDKPNTRPQRDFRAFIHSTVAGEAAKQKGCNWRQPHTSLTLAPKGQPGNSQTYGIKFQWANDYDAVRQLLVDDGLIDINIVPGMTVPSDLFAEIAFRSKENINAVEAEFPNETKIESLGARGDYQLYKVRFSKLGENRLTVRFGKDRHTYLEFFATEPLETLIKKRAAFIARSQHRDPAKWYNGLDLRLEHGVESPPRARQLRSHFRFSDLRSVVRRSGALQAGVSGRQERRIPGSKRGRSARLLSTTLRLGRSSANDRRALSLRSLWDRRLEAKSRQRRSRPQRQTPHLALLRLPTRRADVLRHVPRSQESSKHKNSPQRQGIPASEPMAPRSPCSQCRSPSKVGPLTRLVSTTNSSLSTLSTSSRRPA